MMYSDLVFDHFDRPRNAGALDASMERVVSGRAGSVETGAQVEIDLSLDGARIAEARFRAFGCPHLIASASWLTCRVKGQEIRELKELQPLEIAEVLGLPQNKLGLMLILEDALRAAIAAAESLNDDDKDDQDGDEEF